MKTEITMPVLSDTMQTGRLTRWNKSVDVAWLFWSGIRCGTS